jgi:hypothetical protein
LGFTVSGGYTVGSQSFRFARFFVSLSTGHGGSVVKGGGGGV